LPHAARKKIRNETSKQLVDIAMEAHLRKFGIDRSTGFTAIWAGEIEQKGRIQNANVSVQVAKR
jgi:hypothetical protein